MLTLILFSQDDLLAELEELEQEGLDEQLLNVGGVTDNLPDIPTAEPEARVKPAPARAKPVEEDDDMRELEMWAS